VQHMHSTNFTPAMTSCDKFNKLFWSFPQTHQVNFTQVPPDSQFIITSHLILLFYFQLIQCQNPFTVIEIEFVSLQKLIIDNGFVFSYHIRVQSQILANINEFQVL